MPVLRKKKENSRENSMKVMSTINGQSCRFMAGQHALFPLTVSDLKELRAWSNRGRSLHNTITVYLLWPPHCSQRWQTCIVRLRGQNNQLLCGTALAGQARSRIFKNWHTHRKEMHICVERKIRLIYRNAINSSVCRVFDCKPPRTGRGRASFFLCLCFVFASEMAHKSAEHAQTKPPLCHRAAPGIFLPLHGDSFVPPCVTPSLPLHPSFSTQAESAHWAPPPGVALQWHHHKFAWASWPMHHRHRAVSPNDRARRGRVGGEWVWNSRDGSSERIAD